MAGAGLRGTRLPSLLTRIILFISNCRYNMMTHYKGHQGIHRVQVKNRKCPICGVSYNKQAKLDEHIALVHNSEATTTTDEALSEPNNIKLEAAVAVKGQRSGARAKKSTDTTFEIIEIKCEDI